MDVATLQRRLMALGLDPGPDDGIFGNKTAAALDRALSNPSAPALTAADFERAGKALGVAPALMRAIRTVEAPRGPFDELGRPSILYEKHKFGSHTGHRFNRTAPELSSTEWQPGTYGAFSAQYPKLYRACRLDADAALRSCSWGAFQVLGEHAERLGYADPLAMALALTKSEAAHLDCFVAFVRTEGLVDALRACKPGLSASCEAFVRRYNGAGYAKNSYHTRLAAEFAKAAGR